MFYFYPEEPDIQWFLMSRSNEIRILWVNNIVNKRDAYIQMTNLMSYDDYDIIPNFVKILSEDVKISYPSLKAERDEKAIIITPQWDLVRILPQSEVQVEFEWNIMKRVEKLNWKIGFLSWVFDSNLEVLWYEDKLTQDQQDWISWVQESYKYELVSYLKDQISESKIWRANNTVMYNIDGIIIKYLAKMFPVSFSKNLHNYKEFQKYFSRVDEWVDLGRYSMNQGSWYSISSIWWNMKESMDIWKNNTYWWFKKPEKK